MKVSKNGSKLQGNQITKNLSSSNTSDPFKCEECRVLVVPYLLLLLFEFILNSFEDFDRPCFGLLSFKSFLGVDALLFFL